MKDTDSEFNDDSPVEKSAADWTLKIDRGLTPEEQDQYTDWLAQDPAHREAMALYEWGWDEFDRLAGLQTTHHAHVDPDLLAPGNGFDIKLKPQGRSRNFLWFSALPIAAVLALVFYFAWPAPEKPSGLTVQPALELLARIESRTLEDGSTVELNRESEIRVAYTSYERRVYLKKGEANFDVAKDPNRPFIVNVAGVDVQAVGTVFSVKLADNEVDVIVTEGIVNVKPDSARYGSDLRLDDALLEIGQRALVDLEADVPLVTVSNISEAEVKEALRWQPELLDFDAAPLGEIVAEFNSRNPVQVKLADPSLEMMRLSSSFWSDNVEGFVRLMESSFSMEAEWQGSREIVLRDTATNAH
mgnify:CR=1 FL=1